MDVIWSIIGQSDEKITQTEPFRLVKSDKVKAQKIIVDLVQRVHYVASLLVPIMPDTSSVILQAIAENKKPDNLFARLEK
jgi:methionyl-tRNA synthetase